MQTFLLHVLQYKRFASMSATEVKTRMATNIQGTLTTGERGKRTKRLSRGPGNLDKMPVVVNMEPK